MYLKYAVHCEFQIIKIVLRLSKVILKPARNGKKENSEENYLRINSSTFRSINNYIILILKKNQHNFMIFYSWTLSRSVSGVFTIREVI